MTLLYISVFGVGYFVRKREIEIKWQFATIVIIGALIVRILSMKFLDGTVLYDCLLVYITHMLLTIGLFTLGRKFLRVEQNRKIKWLDDISYFVYLTHYIFMVGPVRTMGMTENLVINTVVTVFLTFLSAVILQKLYLFIVKRILE